jgi:hypothetical protein
MAESTDFAFSLHLVNPINLKSDSLTRKEKPLLATVALHSSILSGGTSITYDGTSNS